MINDSFALLNCIDLKVVARVEVISEVLEKSIQEIEQQVKELTQEGLLLETRKGVMLTQEGRSRLKGEYDERYHALRNTDHILQLHSRFDVVNAEFLEASSDWQQMKVAGRSIPNDHSDPDYDAEVIARMVQTVETLEQILNQLTPHIPRYTTYAKRFNAALDQVDDLNYQYLLDPKVDSLHTIWFEFHEDLLKVLGRGRR
ncbi:hypothetical protein [Bacillus sp. MRMR6]|uniref:hypothetical protein n=1 Tax=Bacillus sp. MRMR6 TaxID=1928617 RepID=UPI000952B089|nr:hypothetical protein [Bacillus sp. MRMR6]OLS40725.1 hypothetical protein BTR25_07460 [Bacillus sp. MRMR6]